MHFSIPETQEIKNGFKTYIAYNIYINGSFHCSLRYRQLYHFHLQLKKAFGAESLPNFPPKKLLPLNCAQIEERRSQLERYVQIASQDSQIVNSDIFNGFLLAAQQESHSDVVSSDCIDIYQLDWKPIRMMINANENSHIVLKKFCQTIKLQVMEHLSYFSLYLVYRSNNDYSLVRRLENFESPLLTLRTMNKKLSSSSSTSSSASNNENGYVIIVHKSYWDIAFDENLYDDQIALNIIYLHTLHNVENGHIIVNNEVQRKLIQLQKCDDKLEYLKLARNQKFYGYIHFEPCFCDLITPKTNVKILAGNQELIIHTIESNDEYVFRVIRIKCWRLTTSSHQHHLFNNDHNQESNLSSDKDRSAGRFELSFEYLVNKDCLKWITIFSTQAVLISYCLQSMVEEMLLKREGKKFRSEGLSLRYNTSPNCNMANINDNKCSSVNINDSTPTNVNGIDRTSTDNLQWNYFKKDGSHIPISSTSDQIDNEQNNMDNIKTNDSHDNHHPLAQQFQQINLVENGVFDEIGDDDL